MKYLLLIALLLGVFWLWRHRRQAVRRAAAPRPAPARGAAEMVACSTCQVHLPRSEALIGRGDALYCSEAHRREADG